MKRFSNGRGFWCPGGKAAKTTVKSRWMWRVMMNLLPLMRILNRKALRRSLATNVLKARSGQKSIRGSTPKVRGTCQIERAASESPHCMRFHVACPHCGGGAVP
ncbi:phage terminase large subunit family protein [Escherichia coli]|uniref:phage terminase large subunit family protein n=1 Tax=Escherichia coli TaxID=562 RepID=UPI00388D07CD